MACLNNHPGTLCHPSLKKGGEEASRSHAYSLGMLPSFSRRGGSVAEGVVKFLPTEMS